MRTTFLKASGVSIGALALGLSLGTTPVVAAGSTWRGGGGGWHGSGGRWAGGGGGWQGGYGGWHGGYGGWHGGGGGWNGGYGGYGNGYGYWGPALGLGLLGGTIIGSQYPYYDSGYSYGAGYDGYPQHEGGDYSAFCANRFRSYNPASGTYLGYDGLRHPCP